MSKNTIKIIVSLGIVVLLGIVIYFVLIKIEQNQRQQTVSPTSTSTVSGLDTSGDIEDRQNRISDVLTTNGKNYRRYSLTKNGPKDLIVTYYLYQLNFEDFNPDRKISRDRRGILVFKEQESGEIELLWESVDNIHDPRIKVGVYDLTGDGINEILALLDNDKGGAVLVYKWNGNGFDMITPYRDFKWFDGVVTKEFAFSADYSMTKIFDVDKDGVPEIVFPYVSEDEEVYRAYKWDGDKYYLWKEQEQSFTLLTTEDEYSVINVLYPQENN